MIKHPEVALVGVHGHAEEKVGIDAGRLSGVPIPASDATNIDARFSARRACVAFMSARSGCSGAFR